MGDRKGRERFAEHTVEAADVAIVAAIRRITTGGQNHNCGEQSRYMNQLR
jgi:hypothetical protein